MEQLMYIGPNITNPILLRHKSVYLGLPGNVIARLPERLRGVVTTLFKPLGEAGPALRELEGQRDATEITANYKEAERLVRGVK